MTNFINSAIATGIAEIITLPCYTIKTNYQNSNEKSAITIAKKIYKSQGIKGFYNSTTPAIASQMLSMSTKFFMYKHFNKNGIPILPENLNNKFICGGIAGIISTLITHPIDNIKIHVQMNTSFINQLKKNGIRLFYRGYSKSAAKASIASSLYLPFYDIFTNYYDNKFKGALASSILSTIIIHPIDYLKTRHIYGLPYYQGLNPRTYYKGLSINLSRIVPHFIITMSIINYLETIY